MKAAPKVGFVALGCPKARVDSERILTQLRAEGYATAPDFGRAGEFVNIRVERAGAHDLHGRIA